MKRKIYSYAITLFTAIFCFANISSAQTCTNANLEMAAGAGNPTASGTTIAPQVITFQNNAANPANNTMAAFAPAVTATYSLSNQQYTGITGGGTSPTDVGIAFGRTLNNVATTPFSAMGAVGNSANANFTTIPSAPGTGIDITVNKGIDMFIGTRALQNASAPLAGNYYYGNLTISFNTPVDYPILHFADFGGFFTAGTSELFGAQFKLQNGLTLTKLSGDPAVTLVGTDSIASNITTTTAAGNFLDGSFMVNNKGVTSITLKVYLKGFGGGTAWSATGANGNSGERMVIGVSIPDLVPNTPAATKSTITNICPAATVNLNTILPAAVTGTKYEWHSVATGQSASTLITNPTTYSSPSPVYLFAKDSLTGCYSPTCDTVNIRIVNCNYSVSCLGSTIFREDFGSSNDNLAFGVSGAEHPYDSAFCLNGYITSTTVGYSPIGGAQVGLNFTGDVVGDGDTGTHFLYHYTGVGGVPCGNLAGEAAWKSIATINLTAGDTYEFSYYYRMQNTSGSATVIQQQVVPASGTITTISSTNNAIQNAAWVKNTMVFTPSASGPVTLRLNDMLGPVGGNDFGLDNIVLKAIGPDAPVPTATTVTNNCPNTTADLTSVEPASVAGLNYEWHTVASNPTAADLVANPTSVSGRGPYYLYAISTSGACNSLASVPVAVIPTSCPINTCTNLANLWAAPNSTLVINGTTVTLTSGNAGTSVSTGTGSPVSGFLNMSAIGTTNSSTVDNNISGWKDYAWGRIHFATPTVLQSPFNFNDIDGFAGSNAEMCTIIGQNGTTIVTPTYTAGSSLAGAATGTINDPTGITLGTVTAYRQTGAYETTNNDARNVLVANFGTQPVTDVYFMWGIAAASGNTGAQYGAFGSTCLENTISSQNPACTSPPYKVYEYNRPSASWASNLPVQIVGAATTNTTLDETTNGTDLNYQGVNWKLVASGIVPDANGQIGVTYKPVAGTTNGSFIAADAVMVSNGFTNTIIDAGGANFSTVGAGWNSQNIAGAFLGNEYFLASNSYNSRTATWSFTNLPTTVTPPTPRPTATTISNICPATTVNLTTLNQADSLPAGYTYQWHTGTPATAANLVSNPAAAVGVGPFYLSIDGPTGCYNSGSIAPVTATVVNCACGAPTNVVANGDFEASATTLTSWNNPAAHWQARQITTPSNMIAFNNFDAIPSTPDTLSQIIKICELPTNDLVVDFDLSMRIGSPNGLSSTFSVLWNGVTYFNSVTSNTANTVYTVANLNGATSNIANGTYTGAASSTPTSPIPWNTTGFPIPSEFGHVKITIPVAQNVGQGLTGKLALLFNGNGTASDDIFIDNVSVLGANCLNAGADTAFCNSATALANLRGKSYVAGTTTWSAVGTNPGTSTIAAPTNAVTTVSGFSAPGTYKYVLSNGSCTDTVSVIVNPGANAGPDQTACLNKTATMAATGTGTWTPVASPANPSVATITTPASATTTITGLTTVGTYGFVFTNSNGCTDTANVMVIALPATPTATVTQPTCAVPSGSINVTSPLGANYTYSITGAGYQAGTTFSSLPQGTYPVTVINTTTGCVSLPLPQIVNAPIAITPTPTITPSGPVNVCSPGSVTLTSSAATGNFWYKDGVLIPGASGQTYAASVAGVYTVVATTSGLCPSGASAATTLTVNPTPTVSVTPGGPTTFCAGGSVGLTLTASGGTGLTYQWALNGTAIGGATASTLNASQAGNYTVTVTNSFGCTATSTPILVTVNPLPTASISNGATVGTTCGGNATLTAVTSAGAPTYQWYKNGVLIPGATNATYSATPPVTGNDAYTVIVTDANSGCTSVVSAATHVLAPPSATANGSQTVCAGGSVALTSTVSESTYQWNLNGTPISGATTQNYSATASGSYTCTVISGSLAVLTCPITITINPNPIPVITAASGTTACANSFVPLASGVTFASYQWLLGGNPIAGATSQTYNATQSGVYTLQVTNGTGCLGTSAPTTVTIQALPATPVPATTTLTNVCPVATVNLTTIQPTAAIGTVLEWHTGNTSGSPIVPPATVLAAGAGTYYLFAKSTSANACYSAPSSPVVVTIVNCLSPIPDVNQTYVNVPVTGNLSTNDPAGSHAYGTPTPVPGNPGSALPTVNPDGTYTFTSPVPGVFTFDVPVTMPDGTVKTAKLVITVLNPTVTTNPPVANVDIATTPVNTPVTLKTLANDVPGNPGVPLVPSSVAVTTPPAHGTTTVNPVTGDITYTPAPGFTGSDTLTYSVTDSLGNVTTAKQIITITPANAPNTTVATDDYTTTPFNTPVSGSVKTNDSDPQGNTQTVTPQTTTIAGKGTLVLASDGTYTFTPVTGFSGPVEYPYTTCDNGTPVACATATLHILVQPPVYNPIPDVNQTYVNVPVTGNLSTNDPAGSHAYGTPTPVPGNPGSALPTVNPDGTYTFTSPVPGVFTFDVPVTMPDGTVKTAKLVITVLNPTVTTNPPVANVDIATTPVNTPVTLKTLANDAPGNPGVPLVPSSVAVTTPPAHGTTTVNPVTGDITYTPAPGFTGSDTLTYSVTDSLGNVTTAKQIITITPANAPNTTVATDDYTTTPFNTPVSGSVKTNDSDPQGNTQTVTPQTTTIAGKGTLVLASDGTYTFTPVAGFSGPVEYPYTTCDNGTPVACATATLHILVQPPVYNPIPDVNQTYVNVPVTGNLSTNDPAGSHAYGTPTPVPGNPGSALPTVNPDGTYTFTSPVPGVFTFDVPVTMPDGTVKTAKLVITVLNPTVTTNPPVANVDIATTPVNTPVTLKTLANDVPGNPGVPLVPSSVAVTTPPAHGTTTVNPVTGDITYTPAPGFTGSDTLTYSVTDSLGNVTTAKQIITITPANAPNTTVATDDYTTTPFNTPVSGSVKTNDSDPQGNTQTVTPQTTTIAGKGTLVLASDGTYTFTPVTGFSGPVEYPYTTCDNGTPVACATATLHILVQPPVYNPIPDVNQTYVNVPVTGNLSTNDPAGSHAYGTPTPVPGNPGSALPTVNPDGTYTFTSPVPGVFTFDVPVTMPDGTVKTAKLVITVLNPTVTTNPPVANVDIATTPVNTPVTLKTLANDAPGNPGVPLVPSSVTVTTPPAHGTTSVDPLTGNITYTPASGFVGTDTLTYSVTDSLGNVTTAKQIITVNPTGAPNTTVAADDYSTTPFNTPVSGNAMTNDSDPQGNAQTITPQTTHIAGKGTLVLASNGTYTFTPDPGFVGPVEFPYITTDALGATDSATIHILVQPPTISGSVLNDVNGLKDATVNGPSPALAGLNANLLDAAGNVVATVPVDPVTGNYIFPSVTPGTTYTVQISTNPGTPGSPAPATVLPSGWVNTGDVVPGGTATDATPGISAPITIGTSNVTNVNFGIEQPPTANTATGAPITNPNGTTSVPIPSSLFGGTDQSGGTVDSIRITSFPTNATSITIDGILYGTGGIPFPPGGVTIAAPGGVPAVPILVDPIDGSVTVDIPYVTKDNAGIESLTPGKASQPFTGSVLGVRLITFTAAPQGSSVQLNWTVSQEVNVGKYQVEYSKDGSNFVSIGYVTANGKSAYSFVNATPATGLNYYRLKTIDKDGTFSYSQIRVVNFIDNSRIVIYPNPTRNVVNITVTSDMINKPATIMIIAMDGKIVYAKNTGLISQTETVDISNLASGQYIVRIVTDSNVFNTSLQVLK